MVDQYYLTAEGAEKLRAELEDLKGSAREDIAKRLRFAIEQGDLSENADYAKAKEDQAFLEGRIQELEHILSKASIIEESTAKRDVVEVGAHITLQEDGYDPETYHLVGAKETNPRNGKISNESPIGKALLGHREGDSVVVETPGGQIQLKIINIE